MPACTASIAGTGYGVRDNVRFRVWALTSDDGIDDALRLRFDLDFRIP